MAHSASFNCCSAGRNLAGNFSNMVIIAHECVCVCRVVFAFLRMFMTSMLGFRFAVVKTHSVLVNSSEK